MADVSPLDPLHYDLSRLGDLVAPPYDVIDGELRERLAARDPHNVVHVDLPEGDGPERYQMAARLFQDWCDSGVLVRDGQPGFFRYSQTFEPPGGGPRITRRGFFALVRADPYADGVVLPHERTLSGPKRDRLELSRATRATLSPQFLLYSDPSGGLDADLEGGEPYAAFDTDDGVQHQLTRVSRATSVVRIASALAKAKLLIADGHHRYETAVRIAREIDEEFRRSGHEPSWRGEHRYTLALLANGDDPNLVVFATHRLVHSLPTLDLAALEDSARKLFDVVPLTSPQDLEAALAASGDVSFGLLAPGGVTRLLQLRADVDLAAHPVLGKRPEVVRRTAVALLHDGVLEHALSISPEDQVAKSNLRYVQEPRVGIDALEKGDAQLMFWMKPTPVSVIRAVAEAGEVMPQKSTYFYPKVPTGLLFHTLDPRRIVA